MAPLSFQSLFVWTLVIGPLGAILAIPLTLLVKTLLIDTDPERAWVLPLISDTGPGSTGASLPARSPRPDSDGEEARDARRAEVAPDPA